MINSSKGIHESKINFPFYNYLLLRTSQVSEELLKIIIIIVDGALQG